MRAVAEPAGRLPAAAGIYALVLVLDAPARLRVGRLGRIDFAPGAYLYVGSARGPGGLRARVGRHVRRDPAQPRHWHVDYLKRAAEIVDVWYAPRVERTEHDWAAALAALPGATIPIPRFGASDCKCAAHLVRFRAAPRLAAVMRALPAATKLSVRSRKFTSA